MGMARLSKLGLSRDVCLRVSLDIYMLSGLKEFKRWKTDLSIEGRAQTDFGCYCCGTYQIKDMTIDIVSRNPTVLLQQFTSLLINLSEIFPIPRNILVVTNLSCEFFWQATFSSPPDLRVFADFGDRMAAHCRLGGRDFRGHLTLWLVFLAVVMKNDSS